MTEHGLVFYLEPAIAQTVTDPGRTSGNSRGRDCDNMSL